MSEYKETVYSDIARKYSEGYLTNDAAAILAQNPEEFMRRFEENTRSFLNDQGVDADGMTLSQIWLTLKEYFDSLKKGVDGFDWDNLVTGVLTAVSSIFGGGAGGNEVNAALAAQAAQNAAMMRYLLIGLGAITLLIVFAISRK